VPNEATVKHTIHDGAEKFFVRRHEQNNVGVLRCIVARNLSTWRVVVGAEIKTVNIGDQRDS
jgi:hypothetical protein